VCDFKDYYESHHAHGHHGSVRHKRSSINLHERSSAGVVAAIMRATTDEELFALRSRVMSYIKDMVLETSVIITEHDLDFMRNPEDHNSIVESLLDLTYYDDDKLLAKSFNMLHRIINTNSEIFRLAEKAKMLIEPTSLELVHYLEQVLSKFRERGAGIIEPSRMR
jgi:hypothetical protein